LDVNGEPSFIATDSEVSIEIVEAESGWSPTISLKDAYKLDDVKQALKASDLKAAAQYGRVYKLRPVVISAG